MAKFTLILMELYSLLCLMTNRLGQEEMLKIAKSAWYRKEYATFSDMLRVVRLMIWREILILRKAKNISSLKSHSRNGRLG